MRVQLAAVIAVLALAGCGAATAAAKPTPVPSTPTAVPPSPTPDLTAMMNAASTGYLAAYNAYIYKAYDADIAKSNRNRIGSQQLKDACNQAATDRGTFDTALLALDTTGLPVIAADVTAEVAADAQVENAEQTAAVNSDSLYNYNQAFQIEQTALGAFAAADSTLSAALGDVTSS